MKTVYLCGPIAGLTADDAEFGWRYRARGLLARRNISTVSPMRGKTGLLPEGPLEGGNYPQTHPILPDKAILKRDRNDVYTCDAVLAHFLDAPRVSIGSMVEFGWADAWNKPVVAVLDKHHDHLFPRQIAACECSSLEEACEALVHLLNAA